MAPTTRSRSTTPGLHNASDSFATLFAKLPEPAYAVDLEGRVLAWNQAIETLTGVSAEAMIGKDQYEYALPFYGVRRPMLVDLVSYDDDIIRVNFPAVVRQGDKLEWDFSAPTCGSGGSIFWSIAQPLRNEAGAVVGSVECMRDVTRLRLSESALRAAKTEMESLIEARLGEVETLRSNLAAERSQRGQLEAELQRSSNEFVDWVDRLERSQKETRILGNMIDHLQACRQMSEAYDVVAHSAEQLFPDDSGFLAMFGPSRANMEIVAQWGKQTEKQTLVFEPDQCWSLRRGKIHYVDDPDRHQVCQHITVRPDNGYLCMPMNAHGEVLGMLHVRFGAVQGSMREGEISAKQRIATTLAEQFALSLSNLKLREILHEQSVRDQLTGLFNRRYMEETLDRELRRAKRQTQPLGIIMLDVDHFKRFNDTFGHETGDVLLRELGAYLQSHIRGDDVACRYGGEEFILIMPGAPADIVERRGEQLRQGIESGVKVHPPGQPVQSVTISLGGAVFPDHGSTTESVVGAADGALYKSKQGGRNRITMAIARG